MVQAVKGKDIAMVILGGKSLDIKMHGEDLLALSDEQFQQIQRIQMLSTIYLYCSLQHFLIGRDQRSAVLFIRGPSHLSEKPWPKHLALSEFWSLAKNFSEGLQFELEGLGVDVLNYDAGLVREYYEPKASYLGWCLEMVTLRKNTDPSLIARQVLAELVSEGNGAKSYSLSSLLQGKL